MYQAWTSYLYPDTEEPRYILAMSVNAAFALGAILIALFLRITLQRANKKLDAGADVANVMKGQSQAKVEGMTQEERQAMKDSFRYIT